MSLMEPRQRPRPPAPSPERDLLALVSALVEELGHPAPGRISLDSRLDDELGIDSLGRIELLLRLQQHFAVTLPDEVALEARTPRALLAAMGAGAPATAGATPSHAQQADSGQPLDMPDEASTLTDVLAWHVARHGDRTHIRLVSDGATRTISYRALYEHAQAVAAHLTASGVAAGERVALMLPTSEAYFGSFFGALFAGAVPVPLYPPTHRDATAAHAARQSGILENAAASALITTSEIATAAGRLSDQVRSLRAVITPDQIAAGSRRIAPTRSIEGESVALVQYTSGSTGDPRGVVLAHRHLLANVRAIRDVLDVSSRDVVVSWLPLYHDMGLVGAWLTSLYCGCQAVIMPPSAFLARPQRWLRAIHEHRGSLSAAPNFAYALAAGRFEDSLRQSLDLSCWRLALNGAEPVSARTVAQFTERYAPCGFDPRAMLPVYGLAENAVALTMPPPGRRPRIDRVERRVLEQQGKAFGVAATHPDVAEMVSCGRPIPRHEVRVVDDRGATRANREVGLVQFRGPSACAGYLRNAEATAALVDGEWINTGDYGYLAEGELFISGRARDMIIRAGRNIFPQELEEAAGQTPGIRSGSVAVFAQPDRDGADRLIVLAETREVDPVVHDELRRRIREAALRIVDVAPDEIVLVRPRTLPRTSSGKIQRRRCRELYAKTALTPSGRTRLAHRWRSLQRRLASWGGWTREHAYAGYALIAIYGPLKVAAFIAMVIGPSLRWRRRAMSRIAGAFFVGARIPMRVIGAEHLTAHRPCLAVVNHQGYLDTLVMNRVVPPHFFFAAKRDLEEDAAASWFLGRLGVQFVDRLNARVGVADLEQVSARIRAGESAVLYPEGIFYEEPGLTRFYMGAFTVAAETAVPVVPVAVRGARSILRGERFFFRRGAIDVTILPPIVADERGWTGAVKLRRAARRAILEHCGEIDLAPLESGEGVGDGER